MNTRAKIRNGKPLSASELGGYLDGMVAAGRSRADAVSFIRKLPDGEQAASGSGLDFWSVAPTGKWSIDYATGRDLARQYLSGAPVSPAPLGWIVEAMIEHRSGSGIEFGFLATIGEHAMAMALFLKDPVEFATWLQASLAAADVASPTVASDGAMQKTEQCQ